VVLRRGGTGETEDTNVIWQASIHTARQYRTFHEHGNGSDVAINFTTTAGTGAWHHVAIVRNATAKQYLLYVDGAALETVGYTTNPTGGTSASVTLARIPTGLEFGGQLDEIRVSGVVRSPAWIKASHDGGRDQLLTYGAPEQQ
jgi:hypothetical protein